MSQIECLKKKLSVVVSKDEDFSAVQSCAGKLKKLVQRPILELIEVTYRIVKELK